MTQVRNFASMVSFRELVLGFLSDRTRLLVTHNMSLAVGAADLVVCLDMCTGPTNSQLHSSAQPKSRVLACCLPADLPGVIQQLRSLHSSGHSKSQTGFALQPVQEGNQGDLSVFMEGLVAAISTGKTDRTEESKDGAEAHSPMSDAATAVDQELFIDTSVDSSTSGSGKTTSPAPAVKQPSRRMHQNNSFKTLSKGITCAPLTPDRKSAEGNGGFFAASQAVALPDSAAGNTPSTCDATPTNASSSAETGKIVHVEGKSVGHVGWSTYWFYFKACGGVRAVVGILGGTALCAAAW
jgi:hypothetical protein